MEVIYCWFINGHGRRDIPMCIVINDRKRMKSWEVKRSLGGFNGWRMASQRQIREEKDKFNIVVVL